MSKFVCVVMGMSVTFLSFAVAPKDWCDGNLVRTEDSISVYIRVRDVEGGSFVDAVGSKLAVYSASGELRGFAELEDDDTTLFQFSVFVSSSTERGLKLKVWNAAKDAVKSVPGTISAKYGDAGSSISLTDTDRRAIGRYGSPVVIDDSFITTKVTFNANGGSGVLQFAVTATNGAAMPGLRQIPTKAGCAFVGYYDLLADGKGKCYYMADGKSACAWDRTAATAVLYAHWREIAEGCYAVVLMASEVDETILFQEWLPGKIYKLPPCTVTPPANKRFAGWACSNGKRYDDGMLVYSLAEPGETVTMTAIWE